MSPNDRKKIKVTSYQEVAVITRIPSLPSPLDPVNGVSLSEKKHSSRWASEVRVRSRSAIATRDVLVLEEGAPPPCPRLAVMMLTTVDA